MMRTGLPNDFSKLNRAQPGPRCFGSVMIQPFRTGAGNPIEIASNVQSCNSDLSWVTSARGVISGPDLNFRRSSRDIIAFTFEPPTSMTRIRLFTFCPILWLRPSDFRQQPRSAPADPHASFSLNYQASSSVRAILHEIATAPVGVVLRLRGLTVGTCRPAAIPEILRDRAETRGSRR